MKAGRAAIGEDPETFARLFTLAPEDLDLVERLRGPAHRLGFALQLLWARARRILVADPRTLPPAVVRFVAAQLTVPPEALVEDRQSSRTRALDLSMIRCYLQLRVFQPADADRLQEFLWERAAHTGNTAALLDLADEWMQSQRLLRPAGETTLARLVYAARHDAETALFARIAGQLSPEERERLEELCASDRSDNPRVLLAAPGRRATGPAVQAECKRLAQARTYLPQGIDWGEITSNRRRQWAGIARRQYAQALRRYPPEKRYTLLAAFLQVRAEELTDSIVGMADVLIDRAFKDSEKALHKTQTEQIQTHTANIRDACKAIRVLVDDDVPAEEVRPEALRRLPKARMLELLQLGESLEQTQAAALFKHLQYRLPALRGFMADMSATLDFASPRVDDEVLAALAILKTYYKDRRQKPLPADAPVGFVPPRWRSIVVPGGEIDPPKWELCLLSEAREAWRAGDLTVSGSRRYTPWDTGLYSSEEWKERRAAWFMSSGLTADGKAYVDAARAGLDACTRAVAERLPRNADVRIEDGKLVLTALERVPVPARTARARRHLHALLPRVRLPELLMEVDRWTGFSQEMFHLTSRRLPMPRHLTESRPMLFAVLVAEATNLGLETMATATGMPYGQLIRIHDWYFREETLRQAITRVLEYHRQLPLTPGLRARHHLGLRRPALRRGQLRLERPPPAPLLRRPPRPDCLLPCLRPEQPVLDRRDQLPAA